jgi:Subtilase family/Secretion system C-terminal sorting domain
MKFWEIFVACLWATSAFGQSFREQPTFLMPDSQLVTVVINSEMDAVEWAAAVGLHPVSQYRPANIVVLVASKRIFQEKILPDSRVIFASATNLIPIPELIVPGHNLFVNRINSAQQRFPEANGFGTRLSIRESRFNFQDIDLFNRVAASPTAGPEEDVHASIMASLVAGAGNSDPAGRGAAFGSDLLSSGFGVLLPEDYPSLGVSIQNHSYGVAIDNTYGANALAYDVNTREQPTMLHVFSAGNSGEATTFTGRYAYLKGFANLTGNFKMAKNVFTVGAVDSLSNPVFFSSRGPAFDGRMKPDLCAFGQDGTSGAAALVSGAAAVLQQMYRDKMDVLPSSDLVRALLINTATDIGAPGPDYAGGFGNIHVENAIRTLEQQLFFQAAVAQDDVLEWPILIPAHARNCTVTLVWNDVPGDAGTEKALVHNLDLQIVDPAGTTWLPWVLRSDPNVQSLSMPATRQRDTLNNVEQVSFPVTMPGMHRIQISGSDVAEGSQKFSVVYHWDTTGHFLWTYPVKNDPATAGASVILRWDAALSETFARVSWKPVSDPIWHLLTDTARVAAGMLRWQLPDTLVAAQVQLSAGAQSWMSDTFLIAPALQLRVGFNCPDSVGLFWNSAGAPARYQLFGLGDKYLEPLFQTLDTLAVMSTVEFPQPRFAVAPIVSPAILGKRSAAPDVREQGVGCYIKNLLAERIDRQIDVTLSLGTTYGLQKITLEKWIDGTFETLQVIEPLSEETFYYTDFQPLQGNNTYRARLHATNGGTILDTVTALYPGAEGYLLFPNPATGVSDIQVLTQNAENAVFQLFAADGRLVLTQNMDDIAQAVSVSGIPNGVYFAEIRVEKVLRWSGGVVIQR